MAGHSIGVLWAAHKNIHCSVAVICVQVLGTQCDCKRTAKPFNSMQNCLWNIQFQCNWWMNGCGVYAYLKCSYFQTPSSWPSGIVNSNSMFDGSFLINCWMYCCTANVLSISSKGSSGHRQKSYEKHYIPFHVKCSIWFVSFPHRFIDINYFLLQ